MRAMYLFIMCMPYCMIHSSYNKNFFGMVSTMFPTMFSGKTYCACFLYKILQELFPNKIPLAFKADRDTRGSYNFIETHGKEFKIFAHQLSCKYPAENIEELLKENEKYILYFNEIQFFDEEIVSVVKNLQKDNIIILDGLTRPAGLTGQTFGHAHKLWPYIDVFLSPCMLRMVHPRQQKQYISRLCRMMTNLPVVTVKKASEYSGNSNLIDPGAADKYTTMTRATYYNFILSNKI